MATLFTNLSRRRKAIHYSCGVAGCAAFAEMLVLRQSGDVITFEKWHLGVWLLPWTVLISAFLALLYLSWCDPRISIGRPSILRTLFWFIAAIMLATVAAMYGIFVLS